MPTFMLFKSGVKVGELVGANVEGLTQVLVGHHICGYILTSFSKLIAKAK